MGKKDLIPEAPTRKSTRIVKKTPYADEVFRNPRKSTVTIRKKLYDFFFPKDLQIAKNTPEAERTPAQKKLVRGRVRRTVGNCRRLAEKRKKGKKAEDTDSDEVDDSDHESMDNEGGPSESGRVIPFDDFDLHVLYENPDDITQSPSGDVVVPHPAEFVTVESTAKNASDIEKLTTTTSNIDLTENQDAAIPIDKEPTASSELFLIHNYLQSDHLQRHPTDAEIAFRLSRMGVPPIDSKEIVPDGNRPVNIGLKDSPVWAVRFSLKSATSKDVLVAYLNSEEHQKRVGSTMQSDVEMVSMDMPEDELVSMRMMITLSRDGNDVNLELVSQRGVLRVMDSKTAREVDIEELFMAHEKQITQIFNMFNKRHQHTLNELASKFKKPFSFEL